MSGLSRSGWLALLLMLLSYQHPAMSEQYLIKSELHAGVSHHDNANLDASNPRGATLLTLTPSVGLSASAERWRSDNKFTASNKNYTESDLDATEISFGSNSQYQNERSIYDFNLGYDISSSLNSESTDFGITPVNIDKTFSTVRPGYTWLFDERARLALAYGISSVDYERNSSGFTPYSLGVLSLSTSWQRSPRTSYTASLRRTDYVSDDERSEYEMTVYTLGLNHVFSRRVSANFSAGISDRVSISAGGTFDFFGTPVTRAGVRTQSTGAVLDLSLNIATSELGNLSLLASLSNVTNSFGGLDENVSTALSYKADMTQLWSWKMGLRYLDVNSLTDGIQFSDRTIKTYEMSVSRKISRRWSINGIYRHISREFAVSSLVGASETGQLSIRMHYLFDDIDIR